MLEPFAGYPHGDPGSACACPAGAGGQVHTDNCQTGGVLWKFSTIDILGTANGELRTVQANEGGAAGDFLLVQPIEGVIRIKYLIIISTGAGAVSAAGYGAVFKNKKAKQPTLDGSFGTDVVCGGAANLGFEDGIGRWVNPGNWQCIPAATNDSPVQVALSNNSGGVLLGMCFGLGYTYEPET